MKVLWPVVRILVVVGLVFLGVALGFAAGMYEGFRNYNMVHAIPQGAKAAALLHELDSGDNRVTRLTLENQVDDALYYYPLMQAQWWYRVLDRRSSAAEDDEEPVPGFMRLYVDAAGFENMIHRTAAYRKTHEAPLAKLPLVVQPINPGLNADGKTAVQELKDYRAQVNATAQKYAP